jgi:hypothetical protein
MAGPGLLAFDQDRAFAGDARGACTQAIKFVQGASNQLHSQLAADNLRCSLQAFDGCIPILRIKQTIELGTACLHQLSHAFLGQSLLFHFVGELQSDHRLDGRKRYLLTDSFFVKPAFEARPQMRIFLFTKASPLVAVARDQGLRELLAASSL